MTVLPPKRLTQIIQSRQAGYGLDQKHFPGFHVPEHEMFSTVDWSMKSSNSLLAPFAGNEDQTCEF